MSSIILHDLEVYISKPLEIPRPRPLRAPIQNTEDSARRFERIMKEIVARVSSLSNLKVRRTCSPMLQCESLAVETNCWLHIVGQHQTSGRDFIGYVSPRLLRSDAEGVNNIQQAWGILFQNLLKSARKEALEMTKALNDTRAQLEKEKMGRLELERQMRGMTTAPG